MENVMITENWILYVCIFFSSTILLWVFYYSKFFTHLDVPNHRSMHSHPTKKSAGLVFISLFIIGLFYLVFSKGYSFENLKLLFQVVPGLLFSLVIGFLDDRFTFSSKRKLFFEILFFVPYAYLFFPDYQILGCSPKLPKLFYSIVLGGYLIFVINLCNFMDGLDLYLTLSFLGAIFIFLFVFNPISPMIISAILLIVVSLLSFAFFNFPPARLFMGDTGSLPLGYMIAILPFLTGNQNTDLSYGFLITPVFWVDGVLTIFLRLLRKENIFHAHRAHLYQKITLHILDKRLTMFFFSMWNLLSIPIYFFLKDFIPLFTIGLIVIFFNSIIYLFLLRRIVTTS